MNDFADKNRRAGVLMQSALRKYGDGDYEGGDKDRQEANRIYDEVSMMMNSEFGKISMLYGESRNFGIAYRVFESNMPKLYGSKEGKKKMSAILRLLKEDKVLNSEFKVFDKLTHASGINEGHIFVKDVIGLCEPLDAKTLKEHNEKFIRLIRKCGLNEYVEIPENEMTLFESIEYCMLNRKENFGNVEDLHRNYSYIAEHVGRKQPESAKQKVSGETVDEAYDRVMNELENDSSLNEDEQKFIAEMSESREKREEVFNSNKEKTLELLREGMNDCSSEGQEKLKSVIESIEGKTFNDRTAFSDVAEFMEIQQTLTE